MKAILEFELPSESEQYRVAMNGFKYVAAIDDFKQSMEFHAKELLQRNIFNSENNTMEQIHPDIMQERIIRSKSYKDAVKHLENILIQHLT